MHPIQQFFNQDLNEEIIMDLMNQTKMMNLIKKRENLSALVLM
jgi:hypothetical protein